MATELAQLIYEVDSRSVRTAESDLDRMAAAAAKAERQADSLSRQSRAAEAAMGKVGREADSAAKATDNAAKTAGALGEELMKVARGGSASEAALSAVTRIGAAGTGIFGALAVAIGGVALAMFKGQQESNRLKDALALTANAAGLTASSYEEMVRRVAAGAETTRSAAREVTMAFVESGRYSAEAIEHISESVLRLADLTGRSREEVVAEFRKMADGPSEFLVKFTASYAGISQAQYEHIRLLEEQGRTTEAVVQASIAVHEALGEAGPRNLGLLEKAWYGLGNAIAWAWDQIKGFGREQDRLTVLDQQISILEGMTPDASVRGRLAQYQAERQALLGQRAQEEQKNAREQIEREGIQAIDELNQRWGSLADNTARANREIEAYRATIEKIRKGNPESPFLPSAAQQAQTEAAIRRRYAPSSRGRGAAPRDTTAERDAQMAQLLARAEHEQLQAALGLARDTRHRAEIEKQIVDVALKERQAQYDRQRAAIDDDRGLSAAKKAQLVGELTRAQEIMAGVADLKRRAIEERAMAEEAEEQRQLRSGLLQAELGITNDISRRAEIERELLRLARDKRLSEVQREMDAIAADANLSEEQKALLTAEREAVKASLERTLAMQEQAVKNREIEQTELERLSVERAALENAGDLLDAQMGLARYEFQRETISLKLLKIQQELEKLAIKEALASKDLTDIQRKLLKEREAQLDAIHSVQLEAAAVDAEQRFHNVSDALRSMDEALRSQDWMGAARSLIEAIGQLSNAFAQGGMSRIGAVAGLAGFAGSAIGGSAGAALGGAANAYVASRMLGGYLLNAGSMGSLGAFSGTAMAIGSIAGPLAIAASALYAAAKLFNLGGKPSNQGAGYDLITGQFSGNKRTQETEDAARAAGDAIKAIQEGLKAAGIELNDAVRGLVIGTRDLSQIYLTSGKTLTSAVGDSAAAVDAALRALLESATFASDAQRQVAMAALAAGGGFEAVAAALDKYAQAQQISANLADEILRLTDPKAYEIQAVTRAIEEQRKAAEALADEGFLAADQLATINDQLSTLERLQLDEVMKRYTDAVDGAAAALRNAKEYSDRIFQVSRDIMAMDAEILRLKGDTEGAKAIQRQLELERTDPLARDKLRQLWAAQDLAEASERMVEAQRAAADALDSLIGARDRAFEAAEERVNSLFEARDRAFEAVEAAERRVISLYQRSVDELVRTADRLKDMVARIREYRMGLNVSQGTPATSYLAARNAFLRISAAARGGDEDAIGKLTSVSDEFLRASLAYHTDSIAYLKDLAAVKTAAAATEQRGETQLTENEKQRNLLEKQIEGLVTIDKGLDDLETAIGELLSARHAAEIADREAQAAQAQLQAMEGQFGQLVTLNKGVVRVEQRLAELNDAMNALLQLQGGGGGTGVGWTPDPVEWVDGVYIDPSAEALRKAKEYSDRIFQVSRDNMAMNAVGWTPDLWEAVDPSNPDAWLEAWLAEQAAERAARNAIVHDLVTGTTEEALAFQRKYVDPFRNLPGFATGGEIMVGGSGGPDSQLVSLWASPNESIQIRRPDQRDDTAEEVRALRSTVERLEKALIAITVNSGKAARAIDSIEKDGVYARGPDPDAPVVTEAA